MKNKEEVIFGSIEEKEATERVLATLRIKKIKEDNEELTNEIYKYAENIDKVSNKSKVDSNYLETIKEELTEISLNEVYKTVDFRVKELAEDFIKRINTRVLIVNNNKVLIDELKASYNINEANLKEDIKIANLDRQDFDVRIDD